MIMYNRRTLTKDNFWHNNFLTISDSKHFCWYQQTQTHLPDAECFLPPKLKGFSSPSVQNKGKDQMHMQLQNAVGALGIQTVKLKQIAMSGR